MKSSALSSLGLNSQACCVNFRCLVKGCSKNGALAVVFYFEGINMRLFTGKLLLAFLLASTPLLSQAQEAAPASQPQLTQQQQQLIGKLKQVQMAFAQTQQAIGQLEEKTMKASSTLKKKRMALDAMIDKKMNAGGYNAKAEAKALREIVQKYDQSQQTPSDAEIADFQKRQAALQQKQQSVMQDAKVQELMKEFNAELLVEAKKIDPNTDALLMRMQDQIKEIQNLRMQLQQSMSKK